METDVSVRNAIETRLGRAGAADGRDDVAELPRRLKSDSSNARIRVLRRLSASRLFSLGQRSGALRAMQKRSGRSFRLDVRQRVIVKALVSRHLGAGATRGAALARHVAYLGRGGAGREGGRPEFFNRHADALDVRAATRGWSGDRHHFRLIISPEYGDRISDLRYYVREVMSRVAADLGEPGLEWLATCHFDTDQPHAHVLVRGRREGARDLVIPRAYVGYGVRARAQEVAQELLGDLARVDAERRIWRETQADHFTGLDRRLLRAADAQHMIDDEMGGRGAWAALTRGRLVHLEKLGLASRKGDRIQLDGQLEAKLRALQVRKDVIRTLNERRMAGARSVREVGPERMSGRVVRSGFHDELGAAPYVVVADRSGVEHYARLRTGQSLPEPGASVDLMKGPRGIEVVGGLERRTGFER